MFRSFRRSEIESTRYGDSATVASNLRECKGCDGVWLKIARNSGGLMVCNPKYPDNPPPGRA